MRSLKVILTSLLSTALILALWVSCTERIDVSLDESYTRLVIEGAITTDTTSHCVKLTTTSSYFVNQAAPLVSGALVTISDELQSETLHEDSAGFYRTRSNFYGLPGHTYQLNIGLKQPIGGHKEYSASSYLFPVHPLDSVRLLFHKDWSREGLWEVKCYVQEPPSVDFYRFLVYRNDKLITDSLNEWYVTDDKFFNGNYTNGASVAFLRQGRPDEMLKPGDKVTIEVNNIGKEYANFLWEAQAESRGGNPLFSGPPANVKGNISNGGVGFFVAYSATRSSDVAPEKW